MTLFDLEDISEPTCSELTNLELLQGKEIPDIDKFQTFSDDDFEKIVEQWAFDYLKNKYKIVKRSGGAGDKGRDIYCFYDLTKTSSDIYQCKNYNSPIMPSDIYVEIGKLIYYTYTNQYKIPLNYYIVAPKGCGPTLQRLIDNPKEFKDAVIKNWTQHCLNKISSSFDVLLDEDLKKYINNFDFSIINEKAPLEFLSEFEKTKYYCEWFGAKRLKRPPTPAYSTEIQEQELEYTNKLFDAYASVDKLEIKNKTDLSPEYLKHLEIQRKWFYSAESLKEFSREALPPNELFEDIQNQIIEPVEAQMIITEYKNGLQCVNEATKLAHTINIGNNTLKQFIDARDKAGMLHQKANEDKNFKWVK